MKANDRLWVLGAALLAIAVVAGGYFLGIAPQLDAAKKAQSDISGVELHNSQLQAELASLAADKSQIDQLNATAAALKQAIPTAADQPGFIRQVDAAAQAAGVTVLSLETHDAVAYTSPDVAPPAASAPKGDAANDAKTEGGAAPAESASDQSSVYTSAAVTSSNLMTIPVTIEVSGDSADKLYAFVHNLQFGTRQVSITTIDRDEEDTVTIEGFIYTLLPAGQDPFTPPSPAPAPAG